MIQRNFVINNNKKNRLKIDCTAIRCMTFFQPTCSHRSLMDLIEGILMSDGEGPHGHPNPPSRGSNPSKAFYYGYFSPLS